MAMSKIYRVNYVNKKVNRKYVISVFLPDGTDELPNKNADNYVDLPSSVLRLNNINYAEYGAEVYGIPETIFAEFTLNISGLDTENAEHKTFISWFANPNKNEKKPVIVIREFINNDWDDIFIGIIEKGISDKISIAQTQFDFKAEQFIMYTLRTTPMFVGTGNNWCILENIIGIADMMGITIRKENRPFGYWMQMVLNNKKRLLVDITNVPKTGFYQQEIVYANNRNNIQYINLYDLLNAIGIVIGSEVKKNIQQWVDFADNDLKFGNIVANSPYKFYKQNYNTPNADGKTMNWSSEILLNNKDLFIKRSVITAKDNSTTETLSLFDFVRMTSELRITSLIDYLNILCNSFLVRMHFRNNSVFISAPENEATGREITIRDSSPVNIELEINNENPLNNINIVYFATTPDEIRDVRYNLKNEVNVTTEKSLTIQYLYNNQIPNNADYWQQISGSMRLISGDNYSWGYWGWHEPNSQVQWLNKPGASGNYTLWYFDKFPHNDAFDRDMPYLVTQQYEGGPIIQNFPSPAAKNFNNENGRRPTEICKEIQDRASMHIMTSEHLKKTWFNNPTKSYYIIKLEIPMLMLEKELTNANNQQLTEGWQFYKYNINIQNKLGLELPTDDWIVINYLVNYNDGITTLELVNKNDKPEVKFKDIEKE